MTTHQVGYLIGSLAKNSINRKLAKDDRKLHTARPGTMAEREYGQYYTVDLTRNQCVSANVDIEDLGRKLKVLQGWEELVEES